MVKMIELDHRFVVVGGLIVACLFYQVPFFTIAAVFACGCAVYARNRYKKGDRVSLGLNGLRIMRQTRSVGRLRTHKTPPNTTRMSASQASTPRNHTWGSNLSFGASPGSPCDYASYSQCPSYITSSRMLQARRSQVTSKPSPDLGSKVATSGSPSFFQKQTTGSLGCKPDMSLNKSDSSYNDICQAKYIGVGVFPVVHLKPSLPVLLSNLNSTMTKSRVTVKVAARESASFQNLRLQKLHETSTDTCPSESNVVIDALKGARKRSMKGDVNEVYQKRQRVEEQSVTQSFLNSSACFLPNGIDHHFNSHLGDESMQILPPHFESEHDAFPKPSKPSQFKKNSVTGRDSIESSYSSSKKMADKGQRRRVVKRKPDHDSLEMPENKISCSRTPFTEIISPPIDAAEKSPNLNVLGIATLTKTDVEPGIFPNAKTPVTDDSQRSHASLVPKPKLSPVVGSKSPNSVYIPSYIPSLDDYLQDKILNEQRLHKMLSAISGKVCQNEDGNATTMQMTDKKESSVSKLLDSQLPASSAINASVTSALFPFGTTTPFTDSATPLLPKSDKLSFENGAPSVSHSELTILPSANLTTMSPNQGLLQAPPTSTFMPASFLNATNPNSSNATITQSFSSTSVVNVPTMPTLPVDTTNTVVSIAPAISSPFNSLISPLAATPIKLSPNPLITPLSLFGHVTTSITTPTANSSATTASSVPFSTGSSMNLNLGNAVVPSLSTSTVASVPNPLFSFGSSVPNSAMPAFSAGIISTSLGAGASSTNPLFSMTSPNTTMPSTLSIPSSVQASTGFQFNAMASQAASPLNEKALKENGMTLASAVPNTTMSSFGLKTPTLANTTAPSLFNATESKPLLANTTTSNSLFHTGSSSVNNSGQSATGGFAFGQSQNTQTPNSTGSIFAAPNSTGSIFAAPNSTGSIFAAPNANQGFSSMVTSQSLSFGTTSTAQTSSFNNINTSTSLVGFGSSSTSALSTGFPSFGSATSTFDTKSIMGAQLGKNNGPATSNSSNFGVNTLSSGANNAGFGASNASFGANNTGFGSSNASFGTNHAGFGASTTGLGTDKPGVIANNATFGSSNVSLGTNNAGLGANNGVFGAGNSGFGANNAGFGTNSVGFGSSSASTGFGLAPANGILPPSYNSSAGNITTTFGGNTKQTSVGGFRFGNTATSSTTVFGNSSAAPTNASTPFSFNGPSLNQSNTSLLASPANSNENNNMSLGSQFTFKGQPAQTASNQGFNFSPGVQPSFNFGSNATSLSTPSMFSVGTGSMAPRLGKSLARPRSNR